MSVDGNGNLLSMFNAFRPRALVAVVVAFVLALVIIRRGASSEALFTNTRQEKDASSLAVGPASTRETRLDDSKRVEASPSPPLPSPPPRRPSAGATRSKPDNMAREENETVQEGASVASQGLFTVRPLSTGEENSEGSDESGASEEKDKFLVKLRVLSDPEIEAESPVPEIKKYTYTPKERSLLQETIFDAALKIDDIQSRREFLAAISHKKVCFHHVPKTGGTNFVFKGMFKALFHWQELEEKYHMHLGPLLGSDTRYERMGHSNGPDGCRDGKVITIIRDPSERYLSAYRNAKDIGETCKFGASRQEEKCECCGTNYKDELAIGFKRKEVGVIDFLQPDFIPSNQMTRMLLGYSAIEYCQKHGEEMCKWMIRHELLSHFLMIGFSEHYEDFTDRFKTLFGLDIPKEADEKQYIWVGREAVEVNNTQYHGLTTAFDSLTDKEKEHVLLYTDVDRILYDEALSIYGP